MNKKSGTFPIYIFNAIEDEWGFISSFPKEEQKKLIHDSNRFADCYLFANSFLPSFTLISPIPVSTAVQQYFTELSGSKCSVLVPKQKTPFTCENIASDKKIFTYLVDEAKKAGSLTIYVYSVTIQVYDLIRKFKKSGVRVLFPEGPQEKDMWTVAHFGSKSGFRSSFSSLMPPGKIIDDTKKIISSALAFFASSPNGIVLKTDKGSAGQGVHILKKSKFKTKNTLRTVLIKILKKEPHMKKHPIILEEYINTRKERKCPFPSVECFIHQNGRIEFPYYCNMIVTPRGEFYGMEMHESVFNKKLKEKINKISLEIARTYRSKGYRGRFDIDMVYDGKNVYADESNTRINGGTDTYIIAKKLIGKDVFSKRYILTSYINLPKKTSPSFEEVKKIFQPYLYNKFIKTGLIINSESVINNGGFSYILVCENKKEAELLRHKIILLLRKIKNE